jgi:DNA-binding response OmpR family regulator
MAQSHREFWLNSQRYVVFKSISDWYSGLMRHSLPILLCSSNEDFRSLVREMLGKNGFFHVLEAGNFEEIAELMKGQGQNSLTIIQIDLLNDDISRALKKNRQFIVLSQSVTDENIVKAAILGVDHFLSFPFSSRHLMDKIEKITQ